MPSRLIVEHVGRGSRITIHGDYDVDGICSTAILVRALRRLGADVDSYIPDRAGDGYGLSGATVERLAARGTGLLITADCAITAVQEVASARSLGMDVVVTDHHTPRADGVLPDAPIVHPGVCGYPFRELCAAAVAYKLAQVICSCAAVDPGPLREDLDMVALATVADVVPLVGENRTLLRRRSACAGLHPQARSACADGGRGGGPVEGHRAGHRIRTGAAPERRRSPLPRGRGARADAHRGRRARRADRTGARSRQP